MAETNISLVLPFLFQCNNNILSYMKKRQIVVLLLLPTSGFEKSCALFLFFDERFLATCVGSQDEEKCALRFLCDST